MEGSCRQAATWERVQQCRNGWLEICKGKEEQQQQYGVYKEAWRCLGDGAVSKHSKEVELWKIGWSCKSDIWRYIRRDQRETAPDTGTRQQGEGEKQSFERRWKKGMERSGQKGKKTTMPKEKQSFWHLELVETGIAVRKNVSDLWHS